MMDTIKPKSDQLNADDLIVGPITVTIQSVKIVGGDQPVAIEIGNGLQPYKPCKSMRRIMVESWGDDETKYVGERMTLFREPEVYLNKQKVGGIRISHMTGLKHAAMEFTLTVGRGRKAIFRVERLDRDQKPVGGVTQQQLDTLRTRLAVEIQDATRRKDWLAEQGISGDPRNLASWTPQSYEAVMRAIDCMSAPRQPGDE